MKNIIDQLLGRISDDMQKNGLVCDDITHTGGITTILRSYVSKDELVKRNIVISIPTELYESLDDSSEKVELTVKEREKKVNELLTKLSDLIILKDCAIESEEFEKAADYRDQIAKVKQQIDELQRPDTEKG